MDGGYVRTSCGGCCTHSRPPLCPRAPLRYVVVDEADEMLKIGFKEEIEQLFQACPPPSERTTMLWSATVPHWVHELSRKYQNRPVFVDLVGDAAPKLPKEVEHRAVCVSRQSMPDVLRRAVASFCETGGRVLVFTDTKVDAARLARMGGSTEIGALTGALSQAQREEVLARFRAGSLRCVVATDVAARGLDIPNVEAVIHTSPPVTEEQFVHRSGRTGRAGNTGVNIVLHTPDARHELLERERALGFQFKHTVGPEPAVSNNMGKAKTSLKAAHRKLANSTDTQRAGMLEDLSKQLQSLCGDDLNAQIMTALSAGFGCVLAAPVICSGAPIASYPLACTPTQQLGRPQGEPYVTAQRHASHGHDGVQGPRHY